MSRVRSLVAVALGAVVLLAACSEGDPRPAANDAGLGKVQRLRPQAGLEGVTASPFDRTELSSDGRRLDVYFAGGRDGCGALHEVETTFVGDDELRITVYLGTSRERVERQQPCTAIGIPSMTEVKLSRSAEGRTITDGSE